MFYARAFSVCQIGRLASGAQIGRNPRARWLKKIFPKKKSARRIACDTRTARTTFGRALPAAWCLGSTVFILVFFFFAALRLCVSGPIA
jgi:hypothetical protein